MKVPKARRTMRCASHRSRSARGRMFAIGYVHGRRLRDLLHTSLLLSFEKVGRYFIRSAITSSARPTTPLELPHERLLIVVAEVRRIMVLRFQGYLYGSQTRD